MIQASNMIQDVCPSLVLPADRVGILHRRLRELLDVQILVDLLLDLLLLRLHPFLQRQRFRKSQLFPLFLKLFLDLGRLHNLPPQFPPEDPHFLNPGWPVIQQIVVQTAGLVDCAQCAPRDLDKEVFFQGIAVELLPADVGFPGPSRLALVAALGDLVAELDHCAAVQTGVGLLVPEIGSIGVGRDVFGELFGGLRGQCC